MLNINQIFQQHLELLKASQSLIPQIEQVAEKLSARSCAGGTLYWCGNGGSAADAQHFAAELVGRFFEERPAIASVALSTDSSVLTALSNDYSFDIIFSRQIEALCKANDAVICISTSGNSANIVKAATAAKAKGAYVLGLTGHQGGKLAALVDDCLIVPSNYTPRIQEIQVFLGHILCEWIEKKIMMLNSKKHIDNTVSA